MDFEVSPKQDDILAYEAHLLIQPFGAIPLNNSITQMQIQIAPTKEIGMLFVDFGNYPQSPPILGLSEDIRPFFNLSFALESVKNWDTKNTPHVKDIINEFLQKLNEFSETKPQLTVSTENEILVRLEKSIKTFFQQRMNMEIKTPVFYCETDEEFRITCPDKASIGLLEYETLTQRAEMISGIFISGKGVFINKSFIRKYSLDTYKHYFSETSTVLVHELVGHAYINENTVFRKLIGNPVRINVYDLGKNPSIKIQVRELLLEVAKFTQEGWSEWIRWFFDTHYDDSVLQGYILSKSDREKSIYYDLKTFIGFIRTFLTFVQTGNFDFKQLLPPLPYEEVQSELKQGNISLDTISYDFETIIQLLGTLLREFSDFSFYNSTIIMHAMLTLSDLEKKYRVICPPLTYGIGFLIFKQVMEKFSPLCMPELLKIVLYMHAQPELGSILNYYNGQFKNWPDMKLALLLAIPVTPSMRIDVQHCKMIVEKYLL